MPEASLKYDITNQLDLNLSYMPFIVDGGLFIPSQEVFSLGDKVMVELLLPGKTEPARVEGKVVWITPKNALYEIYPGIGIQFTGENAKSIHEQIKGSLDDTMDVGGYTYGLAGGTEISRPKPTE